MSPATGREAQRRELPCRTRGAPSARARRCRARRRHALAHPERHVRRRSSTGRLADLGAGSGQHAVALVDTVTFVPSAPNIDAYSSRSRPRRRRVIVRGTWCSSLSRPSESIDRAVVELDRAGPRRPRAAGDDERRGADRLVGRRGRCWSSTKRGLRGRADSPAIGGSRPRPSRRRRRRGSSARTWRSRCSSRARPRRPDFGDERRASSTVSNHAVHQRSSSSIQRHRRVVAGDRTAGGHVSEAVRQQLAGRASLDANSRPTAHDRSPDAEPATSPPCLRTHDDIAEPGREDRSRAGSL